MRIELAVVAGFSLPRKPTHVIVLLLCVKLSIAFGEQFEKKTGEIENYHQTKQDHGSSICRLNNHKDFLAEALCGTCSKLTL